VAYLNANNNFAGYVNASSFAGNGAGLTSLNAGNIAAGTLGDARLSTNVALLSGSQTFSGAKAFTNPANSFSGNGSGLTGLNASSLSSGTLADARLSGNVALLNGSNTFSNPGNTFAGTGAGLTQLSAGNLTTGTLADARLSTNVALRAGGNTFFGSQQVVTLTNLGPEILDQQQTNAPAAAGSIDQWQSFTAGLSGLLDKIALGVSSPVYPSSSSGTISIYAGEGTSGTLLATQAVTFQPVLNAFQTFSLSAAPQVQAGSLYTIRFSVPSITTGWVQLNPNNPYPGGRDNLGATNDYVFKTFVQPFTNTVILTVNASGGSGLVGIGTNSPQAALHVAGDLLTSGNVTFGGSLSGSGAALTSLTASNLTGSVPAATLTSVPAGSLTGDVPAATLTSVPAGNLTGTVADARLSTNVALLNFNQTFTGTNIFNTSVGIGTNHPQATLDVNGSFRINQGTKFTHVQDGIFTAGPSTTNSLAVTNSFPAAFNNPPTVLATAVNQSGTDFPDSFCVTVRRVTTTNFVVNIVRVDQNGLWGQNLRISYHAWE